MDDIGRILEENFEVNNNNAGICVIGSYEDNVLMTKTSIVGDEATLYIALKAVANANPDFAQLIMELGEDLYNDI